MNFACNFGTHKQIPMEFCTLRSRALCGANIANIANSDDDCDCNTCVNDGIRDDDCDDDCDDDNNHQQQQQIPLMSYGGYWLECHNDIDGNW